MADLWFETALLPSGWHDGVQLSIDAGCISNIETKVPMQRTDERHGIAIPGLCNVHSHGFQRGMAGLAEYRGPSADDFWSWREVMYRFLDRLDPDDVEAVCAMAYMEMLESGYTRVGEFHYLHNDPTGASYADVAEMAGRVVAAAESVGIGLTLLPVFYAHADFGGQPPKTGQRRFINSLDSFSKLMDACIKFLPDNAVLGLAPHSLRAVTADELSALIKMHSNGPIHIHAAEQVKEVEASVAYCGERPVEWLLNHTNLDVRWCLVHATHLSDSETDRLAACGAVAGLCPITEANLGDGIFPAARYLAAGGRIGTGTDSNILIDPAQELRALEYSQRLVHRARSVLAHNERPSVAGRLFNAALEGGAQALGVQSGLTVGAPADIVTLNPQHSALYGRNDNFILDSWVFAARNSCIDTVWCGGRKVVSRGQHLAAEHIQSRYRHTLDKILAS